MEQSLLSESESRSVVKKFSAYYGMLSSITVSTKSWYWTTSRASWIQSTTQPQHPP